MCGIAVPVAERKDGRPGSVTLLGTAGEDTRIAALAAALHKRVGVSLGATCWSLPELPVRRANIEDSQIRPGEIAIAAVGAHMSGLPLNGEFMKLGARFIRVTKTAPTYRLYDLPDGPPARPGLVRDESGSSIELEIWALPEDKVGPFLRVIPAPLGLGSLILADGETVNGFICETAGIKGATDITDFGGWRNYINAS
jgi:allophanate hydrolase